MIVKCTNCETKYKLDPSKFSTPEPKIRCKKCNTVFKAIEEKAAPAAEAPKPAAPAAPPAPPAAEAPAPQAPPKPAAAGGGKLVVFGHESSEVTEMASELLQEAGYEVVVAHDGIQALMQIESRRPAVAVLDVALPKMFGFEVVEVVRRDEGLSGVKILLIAAIYDKTRYKRNPQSLYGADDYVEKHMIPDEIVDKVNGLASGAPASGGGDAPQASAAPAEQPAPAQPKAPETAAAPAPAPAAQSEAGGIDESTLSPEEKEDHEKAKRLARIIASDVALYNADALAEGLRNGNPEDALQGDIDEGRKLFVERVPASMRDRYDYIGAALADLFEKKRKELGIGV